LDATAVTGNLTVAHQTAAGSLYLGPSAGTSGPPTLIFPDSDFRAIGVTVALSSVQADGYKDLSVTYAAQNGKTADVIFDVTGYYKLDRKGATFHKLTTGTDPVRIFNTTGLSANKSHPFTVGGSSVVPSEATAVTGNLTVAHPTAAGWLYVGPSTDATHPITSMLNFPANDIRANGVTVALNGDKTLSLVYGGTEGSKADVIFDVTGYFSPVSDEVMLFALSDSSTVRAGTQQEITVTAIDSLGETAISYAGTVHLSSDDPDAILPGDYAYTSADKGVHVFAITLKKQGTHNIGVVDTQTASITGLQYYDVVAGDLHHLVVEPATVTIGPGVPQSYSTVGIDAYGNTIGDWTAKSTFTITTKSGTGTGTCDGPSCHSSDAATYEVTAADSTDSTKFGRATLNVSPTGVTHLDVVVSGLHSGDAAGTQGSLTVTAHDASNDRVTGFTGSVHFSSSDPAATWPGLDPITPTATLTDGQGTFNFTLGTIGTQWVEATSVVTPSITGRQSGIGVTKIGSSTYTPLRTTRILNTTVVGAYKDLVFKVTGQAGVPDAAVAVTGILTATSLTAGYLYLGPTSPNPPTTSTLNFPANNVGRANGVTAVLDGSGQLHIVNGPSSGSVNVTFDVTGYFSPDWSGATFHPLAAPVRIFNTYDGTNTPKQPMAPNSPVTFKATGNVVPADAIAVTGNLTVAHQTTASSLYIASSAPDTSRPPTLIFQASDPTAIGVTVALSDQEGAGTYAYKTLSVTYTGPTATADAIFDVTGYYMPDRNGATFHTLGAGAATDPVRILNTVTGLGLSGQFATNVARPFRATGGTSGVPLNAIAVTGNLTVTRATRAGWLYIGPTSANTPATSTLNFPAGDNRANGVTIALSGQVGTGASAYKTLSVTYGAVAGSKADAIFDVTGYFAKP
jgi:hypothetical protein